MRRAAELPEIVFLTHCQLPQHQKWKVIVAMQNVGSQKSFGVVVARSLTIMMYALSFLVLQCLLFLAFAVAVGLSLFYGLMSEMLPPLKGARSINLNRDMIDCGLPPEKWPSLK